MSELFVVATPIGNLGDMTQRSIETLSDADLILAEDTRHTLKLLNYFEIKTPMVAYHKFNEKSKSENIIGQMKERKMRVALVTDAGTPCISDPGYEIVKEAHENGIKVTGVPGSSAVINALSIAGFDTINFAFLGFIPRENKQLKEFYETLKVTKVKSIVIYESPKRIIKSLKLMREYLGDINIAVMSDMTKFYEKIYRGNLDKVIDELDSNENADKGEYAIVIENNYENIEDDSTKEKISVEALIVNAIVSENISMKDAIKIVAKEKDLSKSEVYDASLKLKELFER